jgi:hypothetical protein
MFISLNQLRMGNKLSNMSIEVIESKLTMILDYSITGLQAANIMPTITA